VDGNSVFIAHGSEEFRPRTEACDGVVGDDSLATAEKGRAMVVAIGAKLAAPVVELRRVAVEVRVPPAVA
jgi:creatinine amidohydrolase